MNDTCAEFSPKFRHRLDVVPYLSPTPVKNHFLEDQKRKICKMSSAKIRIHDDTPTELTSSHDREPEPPRICDTAKSPSPDPKPKVLTDPSHQYMRVMNKFNRAIRATRSPSKI